MSIDQKALVQRLWDFCDVLRGDPSQNAARLRSSHAASPADRHFLQPHSGELRPDRGNMPVDVDQLSTHGNHVVVCCSLLKLRSVI